MQGNQQLVHEGDVIETNLVDKKEGETFFAPEVLLFSDDNSLDLGMPLTSAKVELEVQKHFRGEKIRVFKFKSKSRYRKVHGHRQELTQCLVKKISAK
ncbi:MAG: 50S ribosomal protein L21 [Microgenomates group bacterium GW2011_GWF1_44_10]|nr:MAG: 50S ribosomal protein L21 [Microgenomates group bacterium GW2011_GWF1_44_10]